MTDQELPLTYLDRVIERSGIIEVDRINRIIQDTGQVVLNADDDTVLYGLDRANFSFRDVLHARGMGDGAAGLRSLAKAWTSKQPDEEMLRAAIQVKVYGTVAKSRGLLSR